MARPPFPRRLELAVGVASREVAASAGRLLRGVGAPPFRYPGRHHMAAKRRFHPTRLPLLCTSCTRPASSLDLLDGASLSRELAGLGTHVLARVDLIDLGPALAALSPGRFARSCRIGPLRCERRRTIGHCGREPGEGRCHANIEQWVRSWRGAPLSVGSAVPHRLQPEEAMPIPIRAGDRLGDLRKAAVDGVRSLKGGLRAPLSWTRTPLRSECSFGGVPRGARSS